MIVIPRVTPFEARVEPTADHLVDAAAEDVTAVVLMAIIIARG
jgi:hypothetical protein